METIPTPMFYNYLTVESGSSSNPTFENNLQCQYIICHSRESGGPVIYINTIRWIPAYAGMTSHIVTIISKTIINKKLKNVQYSRCEMTERNPELESLKLALKTEEDGRRMYLKSAAKVTNPLAKSTLSKLAEEELYHIEAIKKFYNSLAKKTGADPEAAFEKAVNYELRMKTIFEAARSRMEAAVEEDPNAIDAYHAALEFEEEGAKMYKELGEKTDNSKARVLYAFLFEQESEHYRMLSETMLYLENPAQWFGEQEKWHFEG